MILEGLLHLLFPHVCEGCGTDNLQADHRLCLRCLHALPLTHFHRFRHNPVEKIFWGRLPLAYATACCYFSKGSLLQHLMHQFKYKGNQALGFYLGQLMGQQIRQSPEWQSIDGLLPLPLHTAKERQRGFNQARILCEGMSSVLGKPVWHDAMCRTAYTESQTRKSRPERWQNMEGRFTVNNRIMLQERHVLLVDDVVTTGATLEACGRALFSSVPLSLSIATLCFSAH